MNLIQIKLILDLAFQGIESGMKLIEMMRNNTEYSEATKEMLNLRIDKMKKEVEDYFKESR